MNTLKLKKCILMIAVFIGVTFSATATAGTFVCTTENNVCTYRGKITNIYANAKSPLFMVYVDTFLTVDDAAKVGIALSTDRRSTAIDPSNLEITKMIMSTLQVAFVSNKDVVLVVQGVQQGYPKFLSVWVN